MENLFYNFISLKISGSSLGRPSSAGSGAVGTLLKSPNPKYLATTEKPSGAVSIFRKNSFCFLAFWSMSLNWFLKCRFSSMHTGHSPSKSPIQRWWKEWLHKKCTAGRSKASWHRVHFWIWKIFGPDFNSRISSLFFLCLLGVCVTLAYSQIFPFFPCWYILWRSFWWGPGMPVTIVKVI